ncbi:RCC1/BLIP-II [Hypoxylon sp. FL1857]|nr:RCC1/BLIP-II [Hypoxylon sp. FL1857]
MPPTRSRKPAANVSHDNDEPISGAIDARPEPDNSRNTKTTTRGRKATAAAKGPSKGREAGAKADAKPKAAKERVVKRKREVDEEEEIEGEKAKPASTRARRPARPVKKDESEEEESEEPPAKKPRVPKPAKPVKSTTRARKPAPPAKKDEAEEKESEEPPAPKPVKPAARPAPKKRTAARVSPKPVPKSAAPPKPVPKSVAPPKPAARVRGLGARGAAFNEVPSKPLDIFVFGEGSSGELGLGSLKYDGKKPIDVKRPRINHNLKGVVDIACGGMHCIALTNTQTVLTWGVNDDKALGRDTFWEGGTRDADADDSDDDEDDTGINPKESTPGPVDLSILPEGTRISQVAATDSASFVLTDDGWVYGWGTFRGSDGIIGFSEDVRIQPVPTIIPGLKHITRLACGSNHVLALDLSGKVFTWGSGGQYQLGRKPLTRHGGPSAGLNPQPCGKFSKKHQAIRIGAGSYHSFYIDNNDQVWAWGLNNYAQTGLSENTGEDDAMVLQPQVVSSLEDKQVKQIVGGEHHSVACTADGELLTWGRVDGHQVGHPASLYNADNAVFDDNEKPRILLEPTAIEGIKATFVAAGTDTSFALDEGGKVYSWGFSANYQTGQGTTDDIEVPTVIDNSAIRDRRIIWAGAGGQFSVVAAESKDSKDDLPNGH